VTTASKSSRAVVLGQAKLAKPVMAGLVPAIHVFCLSGSKDVDARDKRGHDESIDSMLV
jgi:hypothetical protein